MPMIISLKRGVTLGGSRAFLSQAANRLRGRHPNKQAGVGLIEVLVAVLVLSIAFIGIAALQAMSLSTNNSAMARSMATMSSYSIIDAMRADKAAATSYNGTYKADNCPAAGGSLASTQLHNWCVQLGANLGAVTTTQGIINCTANAAAKSANCEITIQFDDSRAGVGGTSTQSIDTKAIL